MEEKGLGELFEGFLKKNSVFSDKKALQSVYFPQNILHREEQIKQIANILAPSLRKDKPSNIFIYGKTGTGKTLSVKHTTKKLQEVAKKEDVDIGVLYVNCKLKRSTDTEYRLIAQLARDLGKAIPATGLPTEEVYRLFIKALQKSRKNHIIILDEIDQLVNKTGDNVLYNLTRVNEENEQSQISIIGISNDVMFVDTLDPRVKSSLSEEEIVFPPYNAIQIQEILRERSKVAFNENMVEPGVIEKCAAYAARDHGDARRALELLRVAGEVADRIESKKVTTDFIDQAEQKIDRDRTLDIVRTQPKQYQLVLFSLLSLNNNGRVFTGEVYEVYNSLCSKTNTTTLTQRRISDIISEFDMLGLVNAKVISKGRYGRTRDISIQIPETLIQKVKEILTDSLQI